jgi:hypothetical protein
VAPKNGAAPDSAVTEIEGRKIVATGKCDAAISKPYSNSVQVVRRDTPVCCPACEHKVARRSRQQKFCSKRCAEKARQRSRKAVLGQDTRVPADPHKSSREINALQVTKTVSTDGIIGPRKVIDAELVAGRNWEQVVSASGVVSYVSSLGRRALVEGAAP